MSIVSSARPVEHSVQPPATWDDPERFLALMTSPWGDTLLRLQDSFSFATAGFWRGRGVRAIHLPVTTGSISSPMGLGSDSLPVSVDLGGRDCYLADSMQFMLEYGCRLSSNGCYYVMPSFRGEETDESHLSQFFHSEAEIVGGLDDVLETVEAYLRALCEGLLEDCADVVEKSARTTRHLHDVVTGERTIPRFTFDEAVEIIGDDADLVRHESAPSGTWRTMTRAGERALMAHAGGICWVTHHDHLSVPFYQAVAPGSDSALSADLLLGVGEVVGAGERHVEVKDLDAALARHQVDGAAYDWYRRMRLSAPLRTSGFGLGVERFFMWVLGHDDIRDVALLTREMGKEYVP